jgi:ubiquinol-cytochrome c reductase iron-sulfur subunit
MSETNGHGPGEPGPERDLAETGGEPQEPQGPHRVIGTPAPAEARTMLAGPQAGTAVAERELPAEPDDPAAANRAAKVVSLCFIIATLAGIGFFAAYVIFQVHSVIKVEHSNLALGLTMGLAFLALGVGAVIWVRHLMPNVELTEQRHPLRSTPENKAAFAQTFAEGAEASQFTSRKMVRRTLIAATVPVALAPILLLRDAGPLPQDSLDHTVWKRGTRLLVYTTGRPLTPAEFNSPGSSVSVIPEGYEDNDDALAKAATTLIKFAPGQLQKPTVMNWTVDNIVAYSKVCTHLGCPAALYEQTTHHILCPCHQSTFAADQGAIVLFGPATRPLPQLPLMLNSQGFLVAASDYHEPVGPSFWERG